MAPSTQTAAVLALWRAILEGWIRVPLWVVAVVVGAAVTFGLVHFASRGDGEMEREGRPGDEK